MYTVANLRKFRVVRCPQKKIIYKLKTARDDAGTKYTYKEYKEIKAGEKDHRGEVWEPGAYGHRGIKPGDIIELGGRMADKAAANPDFEEIKEVKEAPKKKVGRPKKKVGRPRKDAAVSDSPA